MCQKSTWQQFDEETCFELKVFMAFLVVGSCTRLEDGRMFEPKQILLPGKYRIHPWKDRGCKMLILDHDPKSAKFHGLVGLSHGLRRKYRNGR